MGLALRRTNYDELHDALSVPADEILPAPLGGTVISPPWGGILPRIGLDILGELLAALPVGAKRAVACVLVLGMIGSVCAVTHLWSAHNKAELEAARTECRAIEGQLGELSAIVPNFAGFESGDMLGGAN